MNYQSEKTQIQDFYFQRHFIRHKCDDWMFLFKSVLVIYFIIKVVLLLKVDNGVNLHITLNNLNALTLSSLSHFFLILLVIYISLLLIKRVIVVIGVKKIDRKISEVKNRVGNTLVNQWMYEINLENRKLFKQISNSNFNI